MGRPWITHDFVMLVHGSPRIHPWVAHEFGVSSHLSAMGRPWALVLAYESSMGIKYASVYKIRPRVTHGYMVLSCRSPLGLPCVCNAGPWGTHVSCCSTQYWLMDRPWVARGFVVLAHRSPIWVYRVDPWIAKGLPMSLQSTRRPWVARECVVLTRRAPMGHP